MGGLSDCQELKKSQTVLFSPSQYDFPYSPLNMRPSGDENNPSQKRSIAGAGRADFNIHMGYSSSRVLFRPKIPLASQGGCNKVFKKGRLLSFDVIYFLMTFIAF
jgi:hypothetical protein